MFNLQGSELIIILLLALVVLGPEKLPDAMRKAGQFYAELKKMSAGFQSEFRAAVEEPVREFRDTANMLRDSADFTKLQAGEREEKPKSADMAPVDPDAVPVDDVPTFETPSDRGDSAPDLTDDSKPAPFTQSSSTAPTRPDPEHPAPIVVSPPFTGMSSTAPRPAGRVQDEHAPTVTDADQQTRADEHGPPVTDTDQQTRADEHGPPVTDTDQQTRADEHGPPVTDTDQQTRADEHGPTVTDTDQQTRADEHGPPVTDTDQQTRADEHGPTVTDTDQQTRADEHGPPDAVEPPVDAGDVTTSEHDR